MSKACSATATLNRAMRNGSPSRSPRIVICIVLAASVCFFIPFKLSRDSQVLETVDQPAHLTCSGAPARKSASWIPGNAGALKDLRADEKIVRSYIKKCVLPGRPEKDEVTSTGITTGIAIPAGGKWLLSNTLAVCTVLRNSLRSSLPVEVVYNGPEEYDDLLTGQLQVHYMLCLE